MATPKKRTGKASQATRRANWKGSVPATTICPNCKAIILTHTVCPECGYYKNGFVTKKTKAESKIEVKNEAKVETVAEEKTETTKVNEETKPQKEEGEVKKTRKPRAKAADGSVKTKKTTTKKTAKKDEEKAE